VDKPQIRGLDGSNKTMAFGTIDYPDITWHIDTRERAKFVEGKPDSAPVVTATALSDDWVKLFAGKLSATQALMRRKLKVKGSVVALTALPVEIMTSSYEEAIDAGEVTV
jgi:putative sterol carrier protein